MSKKRAETPGSTDVSVETDPSEGEGNRLWRRSPEFGLYLRSIRERKRLSQELAAREMGVSPAYMGRLERGNAGRPPTLALLRLVAATYSVPLEEVLVKAGLKADVPESVTGQAELDDRFSRLILFDPLRPPLMDEAALDHWPPLHKSQFIHFAERLQHYLQNPFGRVWTVQELQLPIRERPVDNQTEDPEESK